MKLSDFDYHLPKNLIAQKPIKPRDHSRLLCLRLRRPATANAGHANYKAKIEHKHFYNITNYLRPGDVLVLNNSKVFPARLIGKKAETGGKIEVFLLEYNNLTQSLSFVRRGGNGFPPLAKGRGRVGWDGATSPPLRLSASIWRGAKLSPKDYIWTCLLGGKGIKENLEVEFAKRLKCKVIKNNGDGTWILKFNKTGKEMMKIVYQIGQTPLPPYIKQKNKKTRKQESKNYQTVYADKNKIGSVAAPTAGFHFTPRLLEKIKKKGVKIEFITLHVGLGTFAPVKTEDITKHKMHAEQVEIKKEVARRILKAKKEGRRIIAVGTTSARALEGCLVKDLNKPANKIENLKSAITNFIYPGYKFKIIDALITNFHLPKSTLLMLVSAFAGKKEIKKIYQEAIKKKYRFYSYGDAMFIHSR